jgi:hypothetical protein
MRRWISLAVLGGLVLAGCGSSSSKSANPVPAELSYFPAQTPYVLTLATDPKGPAVKQAQSLEGRFPLATFGKSALMAQLDRLGIDYQNDIRPLFGNPVALGASSSTLSGPAKSQFLIAWVAKNAGKLSSLVTKLHGLRSVGTRDGAKLYQSSSTSALAIDGATLLFAPTVASLTSALDRHAQGGGISSAAYSSATQGLSPNSLLQIFGNLTGALSSPSSAKARSVPWVAAIRGYAVSISATSTGLTLQYRVDTSGSTLSTSQLPIASGTTPPSLAGDLPIDVGIRDPAQVISFVEAAEQATSPAAYAAFLRRQEAVRTKTGVDLNSLLSQLTGDLIIESDTRTTMGRGTVSDPTTAAQALSKLAGAPKSVFTKATSITPLPGGLYAIKEPGTTLTVGLIGTQLVVGKASPAALRAFAAAPATPAADAHGSVAFRIALIDLLRLTLKTAPTSTEATILNMLGDLTGWTAASTSGLSGTAALGLK